jgi:hypothetical protein
MCDCMDFIAMLLLFASSHCYRNYDTL